METDKNITVACVFWKGPFKAHKYQNPGYTVKWVERLANMVSQRMHTPYEFVCLSNVEFDLPGVHRIPLQYADTLHGWWAKMELFRDDLPIKPGRVLYLDLDLVLLSDLDPFICFDTFMAVCTTFSTPIEQEEEPGVKYGYNTSVMVFDYPEKLHIWDVFIAEQEQYMEECRSDQDFLKFKFPLLAKFPRVWVEKLGICINEQGALRIPKKTKILLCMPLKNNKASRRYKLVNKLWR